MTAQSVLDKMCRALPDHREQRVDFPRQSAEMCHGSLLQNLEDSAKDFHEGYFLCVFQKRMRRTNCRGKNLGHSG